MSRDLRSQLLEYGNYHKAEQPPIDPTEIAEPGDVVRFIPVGDVIEPDASARSRTSYYLAAAAAAIIVVIAGSLAWAGTVRSAPDEVSPAAEPPPHEQWIDPFQMEAFDSVLGLFVAANGNDFDRYVELVTEADVVADGRRIPRCGANYCADGEVPTDTQALENVRDLLEFRSQLDGSWLLSKCNVTDLAASARGIGFTCGIYYRSAEKTAFRERIEDEQVRFRVLTNGTVVFSTFQISDYQGLSTAFRAYAAGKSVASASPDDPCHLAIGAESQLTGPVSDLDACAAWVLNELAEYTR